MLQYILAITPPADPILWLKHTAAVTVVLVLLWGFNWLAKETRDTLADPDGHQPENFYQIKTYAFFATVASVLASIVLMRVYGAWTSPFLMIILAAIITHKTIQISARLREVGYYGDGKSHAQPTAPVEA